MMRKMVSFCIGFFDSRSINPCASKCAMRPLRATSVTAPLNVFASMARCISSVTRVRRSADSPTSSGRTIGAEALDAIPTTSARRTVTLITLGLCISQLRTVNTKASKMSKASKTMNQTSSRCNGDPDLRAI
jgi:hypothetical protein